MRILLDADGIADALRRLADEIVRRESPTAPAVIGIRNRGAILAQRLAKLLQERLGGEVDCGTLDITLHRDDLSIVRSSQPTVRSTEIDFDINDRLIVLVDDVLQTGRTVRAALDALIHFGRPQAVRLLVLVDRGGRQLPIQPDYVALRVDPAEAKRVQLNLTDADGREMVFVQ